MVADELVGVALPRVANAIVREQVHVRLGQKF